MQGGNPAWGHGTPVGSGCVSVVGWPSTAHWIPGRVRMTLWDSESGWGAEDFHMVGLGQGAGAQGGEGGCPHGKEGGWWQLYTERVTAQANNG